MTIRDHDQAKSTVLSVLQDKAVSKVDFLVATWKVTPKLYSLVADAIRKDEIAVIHDPDLRKANRGGVYVHKLDLLGVAAASIQGTGHQQLMTQQLIIHECTHAGFDYQRHQLMTHLDSEAAAYIAGFLFLVAKVAGTGKDARKYWVNSSDPAKRKVVKSALKIAKAYYYGDRIPPSSWSELETGLRTSPLYKDSVDQLVAWDGVGGN